MHSDSDGGVIGDLLTWHIAMQCINAAAWLCVCCIHVSVVRNGCHYFVAKYIGMATNLAITL